MKRNQLEFIPELDEIDPQEPMQGEQAQKMFNTLNQRFQDMEKQIFKSQTQNRRLQNDIKNLQELNAQNAKVSHPKRAQNMNNTSSAFALPSEFKTAWDQLVKELVIGAFVDFVEDYLQFLNLVQEMFILCYEAIEAEIELKLNNIFKQLRLDSIENEKQQVEVHQHLRQQLLPVFQEYAPISFSLTDQLFEGVCKEYLSRSQKYFVEFNSEIRSQVEFSELEEAIKMMEFRRFVNALYKICLHMILNSPRIELDMQHEQKAREEKLVFRRFKNKEYYCIDGFPKDEAACVVVIPPPRRSGYVYQGIKPAIVMLPESDCSDTILQKIKENEKEEEEIRNKKKAQREALEEELAGNTSSPETKKKENGEEGLSPVSDGSLECFKIEDQKEEEIKERQVQVQEAIEKAEKSETEMKENQDEIEEIETKEKEQEPQKKEKLGVEAEKPLACTTFSSLQLQDGEDPLPPARLTASILEQEQPPVTPPLTSTKKQVNQIGRPRLLKQNFVEEGEKSQESSETDSMISPEEKEILSRVSAINLDFDRVMGGHKRSMPLQEKIFKNAVEIKKEEEEEGSDEDIEEEEEDENTESSETDFSRRSTPFALQDMVEQVKKQIMYETKRPLTKKTITLATHVEEIPKRENGGGPLRGPKQRHLSQSQQKSYSLIEEERAFDKSARGQGSESRSERKAPRKHLTTHQYYYSTLDRSQELRDPRLLSMSASSRELSSKISKLYDKYQKAVNNKMQKSLQSMNGGGGGQRGKQSTLKKRESKSRTKYLKKASSSLMATPSPEQVRKKEVSHRKEKSANYRPSYMKAMNQENKQNVSHTLPKQFNQFHGKRRLTLQHSPNVSSETSSNPYSTSVMAITPKYRELLRKLESNAGQQVDPRKSATLQKKIRECGEAIDREHRHNESHRSSSRTPQKNGIKRVEAITAKYSPGRMAGQPPVYRESKYNDLPKKYIDILHQTSKLRSEVENYVKSPASATMGSRLTDSLRDRYGISGFRDIQGPGLIKSESSSSLQQRKEIVRTNSNTSFTKPPTGQKPPKKELSSKLETLKALKSRFRDQIPSHQRETVHYRIGSKSPKSSYRESFLDPKYTNQQQALYEQLQQKQLFYQENNNVLTETSPRGSRRPPRLEPTILPNKGASKHNDQIASARHYLNSSKTSKGTDENKHYELKSPDTTVKSAPRVPSIQSATQNLLRSPFIAGYGGGLRTPKSFKPVLETTEKRGSFIQNNIPGGAKYGYTESGKIIQNGKRGAGHRGLGGMRSSERSKVPTTFLKGLEEHRHY